MGEKGAKKITKGIIAKIKVFKKAALVEKVVLFGSYARGEATEHSDVDLILVGRRFEGKPFLERYKGLWEHWHFAQRVGLPVDFLCFTPEEFEKERRKVSIVSEALREGIEI